MHLRTWIVTYVKDFRTLRGAYTYFQAATARVRIVA